MKKWLLFGGVALLIATVWLLQKDTPIPDFGRAILVFTKTTEYRHDSIPKGIETLIELGREAGFNVEASEDSEHFSDASLSRYQAVVFLNTTGDVLNIEQQDAFERYIQAGGGFLGIHAAADTEWKDPFPWHWYQRLVGGVFNGHPENSDQRAELTMHRSDAIDTSVIPDTWVMADEWYDYQRLSPGVTVVASVDEASYNGGTMGAKHPIAWYREFDGGRSFYVGMGHAESSFDESHFQSLLASGIDYVMQDKPLNYDFSKPESWRFSRVTLDSALNEPLKLTFSPGGDLYFVERKGALKRYNFDTERSELIADLPVYTAQEYGLIGLVFDPEYETNHWLYLYRALPSGNVGRLVLSRFKFIDNQLDLSSEQELLSIPVDGNETVRTTHTGGDMQFDQQGVLWLTTGDDTGAGNYGHIDDRPGQQFHDAARSSANTQDLRGKILRIAPRSSLSKDGLWYDIPAGNLFANPDDGRPEIYIMGLRNPYTLAYDDRLNTVYWGEVGPDGSEDDDRGPKGYDEVNRSTKAGNFGWPYVIADGQPYHYYDYEKEKVLEQVDPHAPINRSANNTGSKQLPASQPAWIYYPYSDSDTFFEVGSGGRNALVGLPFYSEDYGESSVKFPSWFDGKLIIGDFMRGWLKVVNQNAQGELESITPIIDHKFSAPLDMSFGPDGALYVLEYGTNWFKGNDDAYLSRVEFYAGSNPPPVAVAMTSKSVGAAPLRTTLDASHSYDRGGDKAKLAYHWELLSANGETTTIGRSQVQNTEITALGTHTVRLTVSDEEGLSHSDQMEMVVGNEAPDVTITVKGNKSFYFEGQDLSYGVSVIDLEDGSTAKGQIQSNAVTVSSRYVKESDDIEAILARLATDPIIAGRDLLARGSDCHACHQVEQVSSASAIQSIGPALQSIASKYEYSADGKKKIELAISEGSSGQWGGSHAMPAHPDLSSDQLHAASSYILSLASQDARETQDGGKAALVGELVLDQHQQDFVTSKMNMLIEVELGDFFPGKYLLHASYSDKGGKAEPLRSSEYLVMVSPEQRADFLSPGPGAMALDMETNIRILVLSNNDNGAEFVYGVAKQIDLSGIERIDVGVGAIPPTLKGGVLELRLDDPGSVAIGQALIEASLVYSADDSVHSFDVSAIEGRHDLYFGAPVTEDMAAEAFYAIFSVAFIPAN